MKLSRNWIALTLLCLACGDDSSDTGGGQATGDGGEVVKQDGAISNPGSDAAAGMDASTGADGGGACTSDDDTKLPGTCSEADFAPYQQCLQTACDGQYKRCYGAGYKDGKFGGPCAAFLTCAAACGCSSDPLCIMGCKASDECMTCLTTDPCDTSSCKEPSCATAGGNDAGIISTGATCADLSACCNSATGDAKTMCLEQLDSAQQAAAMSNGMFSADSLCGSLYTAFKFQGTCK